MALIASIIGVILGLGAIGAWLISAGRRMAEQEQNRRDIDGVGQKVEDVRKVLQDQLDEVKEDHGALAREVSEIRSTTKSTHTLVEQLVKMHMNERSDGR